MPVDVSAIATIAVGGVAAIAAVGSFVVNFILCRKRTVDDPAITSAVYSATEFPKIHATSGVPTLQQLTQEIEVDSRDRQRARLLYDMGLDQFNHYVNNRDGVVTESRRTMKSLSDQMGQSETSLAENTGVALATADKDELPQALIQYNALKPQAQIYAQHKRSEYVALQTIANDLLKNVSRTDYTSVKSRIEFGEVPLDTIMSELPLPWQELRTINETESQRQIAEKPPKREFIHMMLLTRDGRLLEDKRAERDGKWLRSGKHNLLVPYQYPTQLSQVNNPDEPSVSTGKYRLIIDGALSPEWVTEYWRQGGYRDQQYLLARNGRLPEQLRKAYRWRLFSIGIGAAAIVLAAVDGALFVVWYFS